MTFYIQGNNGIASVEGIDWIMLDDKQEDKPWRMRLVYLSKDTGVFSMGKSVTELYFDTEEARRVVFNEATKRLAEQGHQVVAA